MKRSRHSVDARYKPSDPAASCPRCLNGAGALGLCENGYVLGALPAADIMLRVDAGAYSFEAGNPRHEARVARVGRGQAAGGESA